MPAIRYDRCREFDYVIDGEIVHFSWHGSRCTALWRKGIDGWIRYLFTAVRCYCPCGHKEGGADA
jgi:hypothetical protein